VRGFSDFSSEEDCPVELSGITLLEEGANAFPGTTASSADVLSLHAEKIAKLIASATKTAFDFIGLPLFFPGTK
jgi:hypothetical protein